MSLWTPLLPAVLVAASNVSSAQASDALVIRQTTVIDATGAAPRAGVDVLIRGGRIAAIGRSLRGLPANTQSIDGRKRYVIPGLWDMHVHGTAIPSFLGLYLANGVTGIRDLFDPMLITPGLRDRIARGEVLGPRIVTAGKIIDGPDPFWPGSHVARTAEEGRAAVAQVVADPARRADLVKVYSRLPREAYFAIAEDARRRGVPFDGHVPYGVTAWEASDAGQRSMEHLYGILSACARHPDPFLGVDIVKQPVEERRRMNRVLLDTYDPRRAARFFAHLKRNRTYQCPTLTVLYSMSHLGEPRPEAEERFQYVPWLRNSWKPPTTPRTPEEVALNHRMFEKSLELVGAMHRAGVPIVAGTDVMNPYCFPGFSLHDELAWLVRAGLRPLEALQAATRTPARFLGIERRTGTVEVGKDADLVVLDADPLRDIRNTTRIHAVVRAGRLLDRPALDRLLRSGVSKPAGGAPAFEHEH